MNDYVHIEAADLCRPNARFTQERQGYQVLTLFGKLGYSQYIDAVRLRYALPFFVERFFRTNEDWERVAATDFRHVSWSSRTEASLDQVISRPATIILGEPGAGKSTLVKAIVQRAVDLELVPLVAELRSYAGDLTGLLAQAAPADLLRDTTIVGEPVRRIVILDGLDEVPQDRIEKWTPDRGQCPK